MYAQNFTPIDLRDTAYSKIDYSQFSIDETTNSRKIGSNPNMFRRVLNQQFSNLITGQSNTKIGNFASLDLTDPSVSFAGNIISKNGSVFSMKVNGSVSDGFFSIFNNSKLNTQISLDLQYNFLNLNKLVLISNADSVRQYNDQVAAIKFSFEESFISIERRRDIAALEKSKISLNNAYDSLRNVFDLLNKAPNSKKDMVTIASLDFLMAKTMHLYDSTEAALNNLVLKSTLLRNLKSKTIQKLRGLSFQSAVEGFSFGWFSVGYKVNNNSFKFFDPTLAIGLQVADTSFVSHEFKFQYSHYKFTPVSNQSRFYDLGIDFTYADNFSSLTKKEISETTNYGLNPGDRSSVSKYDVYQGLYKKNQAGLIFFADYYYFIFQNNIGAIHINPEWRIANGEKPIGDLYTGFLFSFKDSKTDNAVVNAELYYKFLDIFKTTDTEYKLFERNNIGIRFTFPIKFK